MLAAYESSGMSIREFSERAGVSSRTIGNWLRDRRNQTGVFSPKTREIQPFVKLPTPKTYRKSSKQGTSSLILRRNDWSVEIPEGCELSVLCQVLSALEGLYAV